MKKLIIAFAVLAVLGAGAYLFFRGAPGVTEVAENPAREETTPAPEKQGAVQAGGGDRGATKDEGRSVLGKSVEGRDIAAYHYGDGAKEILFVGGIHGGYSWNTVLVAYQLMDYLAANPGAVPAGVKVTVVPVLNPDGLNKVVGAASRFARADAPTSEAARTPGRFNANGVDLNRNFDCAWKPQGVWRDREVGGGSQAFSEPEAAAIKNYVEARRPAAVLVWYSAAGGVFASNCGAGILPEAKAIMDIFARASGYRAYDSFDFYELTGDMTNWLARINIPAISVLLTTHEDMEWDKNIAGIKALLAHYAKQ